MSDPAKASHESAGNVVSRSVGSGASSAAGADAPKPNELSVTVPQASIGPSPSWAS